MKFADCIVAGGGFPGIYAAWRIAKSGKNVCLVEASDSLGGVMKSREWNGYWLDNGTQNLDLRSDNAREFYTDILGEDLRFLENHDWASTIDTTPTLGFEMPDFSVDDTITARRALNEITKLENKAPVGTPDDARSFLDWYESNYGPSLTSAIRAMLEKVTGGHTDAIGVHGRSTLSMLLRPKLANDDMMVKLKSSSAFFNDRMGVTRHCGDDQFTGSMASEQFAYPSYGGLGQFCKRAEQRLQELGVDIQHHSYIEKIERKDDGLSVQTSHQEISASTLLWTLPDHLLSKILNIHDNSLKESLPVGYCIYAFEVKGDVILGPDYLHDYSNTRLPFRYSRPGIFSGQSPRENHTIVMAEVPSHPGDQESLMQPAIVEKVWEDCISAGYVKPETLYTDACYWGVPVAFTLPTSSWKEAYDHVKQEREKAHQNIVCIEPNSRGRAAFIRHFDNQLGALVR
ncbi:MAG: NAD(P)-binding protein [Granulosicoccus sp.]